MNNLGNNVGNIINRFLKMDAAMRLNNIVVGANTAAQTAKVNTSAFPQTTKALQQSSVTENFFNNNIQLSEMSTADRATLLKDMLKLPSDLNSLLTLVSTTNNAKATATLLQNLDMSKLAQLLQQNGKEAINNLTKMISNFQQQGVYKTSQLTELIGVLSVITSSAETPSLQVLKNIILLYLPWLPLAQGQDFDLEITARDEEGNSDDDVINIQIETINYGLIKAMLFQQANASIELKVSCPENFPKQKLIDSFNSESKDRNLQTKVDVETAAFIPVDKENEKPKVDLNAGFAVTPYLVLMAHIVIKTVLEIDNQYDLDEIRKEQAK